MLLPQPIARGRLISRYKRFFADVELDSGEIITAHCANTGSMLGLKEPGQIVWVSKAANPKRTLGWDLQMVQLPTGLVGINTGHPNRIVGEAIAEKAIAPLVHYSVCRPEVKYGENSRIDFLLSGDGLPDCYVEVKNVHFSRTIGLAEFPDSRTERGAKHLAEMANMVRGASGGDALSGPARRLHADEPLRRSRPGLCGSVRVGENRGRGGPRLCLHPEHK